MSKIDLINSSPEVLAETADLNALLETVKGIDRWEDRHGQVLDHIYRQRLIKLIRTGAPVNNLRALNEHLARVAHPRRFKQLDSLDRPYGARWTGYQDILESRIAALESNAPKQLLKRAHVKEILNMLIDGSVRTQSDIKTKLKLQPANLTRILNMMESNELIKRKIVGRENRIVPGPNAGRFLPVRHERRGASYLRLEKAA